MTWGSGVWDASLLVPLGVTLKQFKKQAHNGMKFNTPKMTWLVNDLHSKSHSPYRPESCKIQKSTPNNEKPWAILYAALAFWQLFIKHLPVLATANFENLLQLCASDSVFASFRTNLLWLIQ